MERAVAYVEAGADMIFPEAMTELAMYDRFKKAVKVPDPREHHRVRLHPVVHDARNSATVDVDIVLFCCSAYRAMNAAALKVYQSIRAEGTQKNVVDTMQTRADLYRYLGYHEYEDKLDALFAKQK